MELVIALTIRLYFLGSTGYAAASLDDLHGIHGTRYAAAVVFCTYLTLIKILPLRLERLAVMTYWVVYFSECSTSYFTVKLIVCLW